MEMALFHRDRKSSLSMQRKPLKDLTRIIAPSHFLAEEKRHALLNKMRDLTQLEIARYDSLCLTLIDNLVLYCQSLPETTNSYYSQTGGLVDHALNRTEAALSLFQEFMMSDAKDSLSEEQKLWQYALYSAAILQGIGKLFVEYRIDLYDASGNLLKEWNPLLESMGSIGQHYSYEFQKEPEVEFRRRINLLLARALMPASGFSWIASNGEVLAVWLALLNEDERSAGTLGAILIRADAIAIQRYFTDFMQRHGAHHSAGRYGSVGTFAGGSETLLDKEQAAGLEFIQWMTKALGEGIIMINKAPLLSVPGGLLLCDEMFQLFVQQHPDYKNWQAVKNGFVSLGLHRRGVDGSAMSRYEHAAGQGMYNGVVFDKYAIALPGSVKVQHLSGKVESMSSMELASRVQHQGHLQKNPASSSLQKLNAAGQWQVVDAVGNTPSPGVKRGG